MALQYDTPQRRDSRPLVAETKAQLQLLNPMDREIGVLLGSTAAGDQAMKWFWYDASSTASDSGTTTIKSTAVLAVGANAAGTWRSTS